MRIDLRLKGNIYRYVVSKNGLVSDVLLAARKDLGIPDNVIVRNDGRIIKPNFFLKEGDILDIHLAEAIHGKSILDASFQIGVKIKRIIDLFGQCPLGLPKDRKPLVFVNGRRLRFLFNRKINQGDRVEFA